MTKFHRKNAIKINVTGIIDTLTKYHLIKLKQNVTRQNAIQIESNQTRRQRTKRNIERLGNKIIRAHMDKTNQQCIINFHKRKRDIPSINRSGHNNTNNQKIFHCAKSNKHRPSIVHGFPKCLNTDLYKQARRHRALTSYR